MTVRELIAELIGRDLDAQVVVATWDQGTQYIPATFVESGQYEQYTTWSGVPAVTGDFKNGSFPGDNGVRAVLIGAIG